MKLMPRSKARCSVAMASASSEGPYAPDMLMQPRPIGGTSKSVVPNLWYCIEMPPSGRRILRRVGGKRPTPHRAHAMHPTPRVGVQIAAIIADGSLELASPLPLSIAMERGALVCLKCQVSASSTGQKLRLIHSLRATG